jgi:hypothetical protein
MTDCTVYVGNLDDPDFKWEGGSWDGNVPERLSQEFPPMGGHYNSDFHDWVKRSGNECKQTDFGGWVVRLKKSQILEFVDEVYRGKEGLPWVKTDLKNLKKYLKSLDEDRVYALVATEF